MRVNTLKSIFSFNIKGFAICILLTSCELSKNRLPNKDPKKGGTASVATKTIHNKEKYRSTDANNIYYTNHTKKQSLKFEQDSSIIEFNSLAGKWLTHKETTQWFLANKTTVPRWVKEDFCKCKIVNGFPLKTIFCSTKFEPKMKNDWVVVSRFRIVTAEKKNVHTLLSLPISIFSINDSPDHGLCGSSYVLFNLRYDALKDTFVLYAPHPKCGCPGIIPRLRLLEQDTSTIHEEYVAENRKIRKLVEKMCASLGEYKFNKKKKHYVLVNPYSGHNQSLIPIQGIEE